MKPRPLPVAAAWLAGLLAGCAMAPQPRPAPTLQVPEAWHTELPGPGSALERDCWRAFRDPALDALVRQALERNADVRTARSRLQEYQARVTVAASGQLPMLTGTFNPSRQNIMSQFGTPLLFNSIQGNVQASYELDLSGRLAENTAAARFEYQSQQAAAEAAALSVAASTASGYLNLRGLDAQLELARETLASRQRSFELARREFEVGYSSRLDLAQAEAELRAAAQVVPQLQRSIADQESALNVLIGNSPGPIRRGAELSALTAPPVDPGLPSELLRRRPDIAQAERAVAAADAGLAAARDQLLPSVQLTASTGPFGFTLPQMLNSPVLLWSIGGSVLAPIFNGGRLRAQADIAASQRDRAVFAYESVVRTAFAETENALDGVERLEQQLTEAEARSEAAAEALRIARNRHANGYASYLEELDAQRTALSAEVSVLQLKASLLGANVDLYRALGGGWTPPR
jgi:NodT family efflux transporter outer membrane factor (OMF) lipoprotein